MLPPSPLPSENKANKGSKENRENKANKENKESNANNQNVTYRMQATVDLQP